MMLRLLLGALLLGALASAGQQAPLLSARETFVSAEQRGNASLQALFAPGAALGGEPLAVVAAADAAACSAACRASPDGCGWWNWCGNQGGCADGGGGTGLGYQECQLLASNCTLAPPVLARGGDTTAGFPLHFDVPTLPGVVGRSGQGIQGADFECAGTVVPGKCAFAGPVSELLAATACSNALANKCRSAVVYTAGLDGCSDRLVLLKSANLAPSNSFVAPTVYTVERVEGASTGGFILRLEATVLGGPNGTADASASGCGPGGAQGVAANGTTAAGAANSTANCTGTPWLGCLVSDLPAVIGGDVVATLDGVASPEPCCRECRQRSPGANVFNYCAQQEGCRFRDASTQVVLEQGQCELRFQKSAAPSTTLPPLLLAKGQDAGGFTAGAPLVAFAPEVAGFTRYLGAGLFGQPGTPCPGSATPNLQECTLQGTLLQLADRCEAAAECAALIYKPAGLLDIGFSSNLGALRHAYGANASLMIANPTTVVYIKEATAAGSDSDSGLPAGAIAGLAAGCAVLAAAAAAAGWVLLQRRRRMRQGVKHAADPKTGSDMGAPVEEGAGPGPGPPLSSASAHTGSSLRASLPASPSGSQRQASFGVQQPCRTAAPGQHIAHIRIRPVASASPFASMRQMRLSASGVGLSAGTPSSTSPFSGVPSWQVPSAAEPELQGMVSELLQFRAREEQAAASLLDGNTSCGNGAAVDSRATTGGLSSGGASGISSSSSSTLAPGQLARDALPASLQAWLLPASAIQFQQQPTGERAVLGEGASGRVLLGEFRGEPVAVKEVHIGRGQQVLEAFVSEAHRMQQLRHPNIVNFFAVAVEHTKGLLIMELCAGRDLGSALGLRDASGSRLFGWHRYGLRVAAEVAQAVNYLHSQSPAVVHMDIKSTNVLLSDRGVAKLSDVGVSRTQTKTYLSLPTPVGTFAWRVSGRIAPEVLMGGRCTAAVDIYSFGVLLWEIMTGERPVRGNLRMPRVPEEASQEAADLMEQCTRLDPSERPTALEAMKRLHAMVAAGRTAPATVAPSVTSTGG